MEKTLEELRGLIAYRAKEMKEAHQPILALGLSSRKVHGALRCSTILLVDDMQPHAHI